MFRNKRWICNFIALIILIAGMCVDEVRVDSSFMHPQIGGVTNGETMDAVFTDVDMDSRQLLCTGKTISGSQIVAQIVNVKRTIKLSMVFLCVAVFSLLLSNFYTAEREVEYPRLRVQTAVLEFIHNTDGKK